ncbi:MAG: DNA-directed RNA polymerase subunit H [Nanoarchaeota archaeon]|nr:DNA-directed RNA polymerase subunit H [Nanoarchaeota archaeon]
MEKEELKHALIPKHSKLNKEDSEKLLKEYNISKKQLPKILSKDPAIAHLDIKKGDIIKIERDSPVSVKSIFYRVVIG